jgi:hypothetical protein
MAKMVSFDRLHYERKDKQILGGGALRSPGEKRMAATLGPMDTVIMSKFMQRGYLPDLSKQKYTNERATGHRATFSKQERS